MPASTEDSALIQSAVAYLNELHRALTQENGAATLILADPELRAAVAEWGAPRRPRRRQLRRRADCRSTTPTGASGRTCQGQCPQSVFGRPAKPGA
jgi:hypothetical protein